MRNIVAHVSPILIAGILILVAPAWAAAPPEYNAPYYSQITLNGPNDGSSLIPRELDEAIQRPITYHCSSPRSCWDTRVDTFYPPVEQNIIAKIYRQTYFVDENGYTRDLPGTWGQIGVVSATPRYGWKVDQNLGENCSVRMCGNPIDVATGNKFQREVDIRGVGDLEFVRYYNAAATGHDSNLGDQWTYTFSGKITVSGDYIELLRDDGRLIDFKISGEVWVPVVARYGYISRGEGGVYIWRDEVNRITTTYFADGRIKSVLYPDGRAQYAIYSPEGLITRLLDSKGRFIDFVYDGDRLSSISAGAEVVRYHRDAQGHLAEVEYQGGARRKYAYVTGAPSYVFPWASAALLASITNENNEVLASYTYGPAGANRTQHAGAYDRYDVVNSSSVGDSVVTSGSGLLKSTYSFTASDGIPEVSKIVEQCQDCGIFAVTTTRTFVRDPNHNLVSESDVNGRSVLSQYDSVGRKVEEHRYDASGAITGSESSEYSQFGVTQRVSFDTAGVPYERAAWKYDGAGRLTEDALTSVDGVVSRTSYQYCDEASRISGVCSANELIKIDGPRSDVSDIVELQYYISDSPGCSSLGCDFRRGDLKRIIDGVGKDTAYLSYDLWGMPKKVRETGGLVTEFEIDGRGRMVGAKTYSESSPSSTRVVSQDFYSSGLLRSTTSGKNGSIFYTYDLNGRLRRVTDSAGSYITYEYTSSGAILRRNVYYADGVLAFSNAQLSDASSRVFAMYDGDGNRSGLNHNPNGGLASFISPLSYTTKFTYDGLGRVASVVEDSTQLASTTSSSDTMSVVG